MRNFNRFLIIICVSLLLINWGSGPSVEKSALSKPDSIIYKQTPQGELKLFFHYPGDWKAKDERPIILFFFGGGWKGGTTEQFRFQADYFASRGMVAVRAEYRVLSRHGTTPDKCVEDGKSAVRWLRRNAAIIGGNPEKIVSSGGSAGGHVAICTYVVKGLEAEGEDISISSKPNLLVLFNPVLVSLKRYPVDRFPSEEIAIQISPTRQIDKTVPPLIMFFGSEDPFGEYIHDFMKKASDLELDARLWIAGGEKHGFFNNPPWRDYTLYRTGEFLAEHGYLKDFPQILHQENHEMKLYKLSD